jgi:hypothetical protein
LTDGCGKRLHRGQPPCWAAFSRTRTAGVGARQGVRRDVNAYNALIATFVTCGQQARVAAAVEAMQAAGVQPNEHTAQMLAVVKAAATKA